MKKCKQCRATFENTRAQYCSQLCRGRAKEDRLRANPEAKSRRLEKNRAADMSRYWADPEKHNAETRKNYAENAVARRAAALERYYKDPQATIERNLAWRQANREKSRSYMRAWRKLNIEKARHSGRVNNWNRRSGHRNGFVTLEKLVSKAEMWGNACWMCGGNFSCWDHVKPVAKGGVDLIANLRPSCGPCNSSKSAKWYGPNQLQVFKKKYQEIM